MKDHRNTSEDDALTAVREHREALEALTDTDLPAALWAGRLLALLDDYDSNQRGDSL